MTEDDVPSPPNTRTFTLNSPEFYEAVCPPRERPWIPNGSLPRDKPLRNLPVIIDAEVAGSPSRPRLA